MKNIYRVTRPAWALMENWEAAMILGAGLALGVFGAAGFLLHVKYEHSGFLTGLIDTGWPILELLVSTFGCFGIVLYYRRQRVGCYPSTFIYGFYLPEASNLGGKSQVVGYCHVTPELEDGEITVAGASFFWDNGELDASSRVGFTSTHVRGTKEGKEATCHIRFNINREDSSKRLYRHGLLRFRLVDRNRYALSEGRDLYAGYLQSTRRDAEIPDIEVRSMGIAEWNSAGDFTEDEAEVALRKRSPLLFATLDAMIRHRPLPSLWQDKDDQMNSTKTNYWGQPIPTPQSVMLNEGLRPQIDAFLAKVLGLNGLRKEAISAFTRHARAAATDTILISYEKDLKDTLGNLIVTCKRDEALNDRANVICKQITPFLDGQSLLDVGCGNGMIAHLLRHRFTRLQLLDVVQYVPIGYDLPFVPYIEGQPLPITESFDTVLLLTVLHHSIDPIELLKLAWAATNKRLIIIESVVGVHEEADSAKYELLKSSDDDQVAFATFVDWFYNRVLHHGVPVPYNFTTPERWQSIFLENRMPLVQTKHLGQDIDIGPEYHILFVLEKPAQSQASAA
jgi:SAM-dependent methyltransferase